MARLELVAYNTGLRDYAANRHDPPKAADGHDIGKQAWWGKEVATWLRLDPERFIFFWHAGHKAGAELDSR